MFLPSHSQAQDLGLIPSQHRITSGEASAASNDAIIIASDGNDSATVVIISATEINGKN